MFDIQILTLYINKQTRDIKYYFVTINEMCIGILLFIQHLYISITNNFRYP